MGRLVAERVLACLVSLLVVGVLAGSAMAAKPEHVLLAVRAPAKPKLDGLVDKAWERTPPTEIALANGANLPEGKTTLKMRAMYDKDTLYLLVQYADPTHSLQRSPWQMQEDGTWKKLKAPYDIGGDNNTYYEDKFAMFWNITSPAFQQEGCAVTCHTGEGKPYGNHYTPEPNAHVDIWHLKTVRTAPLGQVDDQYLDGKRYDYQTARTAGRHSDPAPGGGYYTNVNATKSGPKYALPVYTPGKYWILDSEKILTAHADIKPMQEVPGVVIAGLTGDRGDIATHVRWHDGVWTMEIARKLVTGSLYDVQFDDLKRSYAFGAAVFDNAQVRHAFHEGAGRLEFR